MRSKKFKLIFFSSVLFAIVLSTCYVDYRKEDIQSLVLGEVDKTQVLAIQSAQEGYNKTYYNLKLLPEQREFLKKGMQEALPNEIAFCLYGVVVNNTIMVNNIYDGTLSSTPISGKYHCEVNGDFLFAIHSHPDSFEEWECLPSDKDLYSVSDESLKLNGILCFDDNPSLYLTDINRELLEVQLL